MSLIVEMYQLAREETDSRLLAAVITPILTLTAWLLVRGLRDMEKRLVGMGAKKTDDGGST